MVYVLVWSGAVRVYVLSFSILWWLFVVATRSQAGLLEPARWQLVFHDASAAAAYSALL